MRVGSKVTYVGDQSPFLQGYEGVVVGRKENTFDLWAVQWEHMADSDITYIREKNLREETPLERRVDAINEVWNGELTRDLVEPYEPIVAEAQRLVYGDRNKDYGHPYEDYKRNATFLTEILRSKLKEGEEVDVQEACIFMIMLKCSRLINDPTKRDSIVDVAGYAECLSRINRREAGLE